MKHIIEKIKNPDEFEDIKEHGNSWLLLIYDDEINKMKYEGFPNEIIEGFDNVEYNSDTDIWEVKNVDEIRDQKVKNYDIERKTLGIEQSKDVEAGI